MAGLAAALIAPIVDGDPVGGHLDAGHLECLRLAESLPTGVGTEHRYADDTEHHHRGGRGQHT